jgi:transposase-like protein
MTKSDIQNPAFHDEDKARETLEAIRWPDGPYCPHCGNADQAKIAKGEGKAHRPGLYYCATCNGQFTVTVGTVMERSKIPLSKWLFAMHLMGASKKGMSALQLKRMLGVTYKTAWFMCHRIREAMTPEKRGPIGGTNRVVESDETVIGGKKKNRAFAKKEPKKHTVLTLVDRDGDSHSFHVANVKAKTLRETIVKVADRESHLMTDELASYARVGREFAGHTTVNRAIRRICSRQHSREPLQPDEARRVRNAPFDQRGPSSSVSDRMGFQVEHPQGNRRGIAALIAKGIEGKRLTYRPTH